MTTAETTTTPALRTIDLRGRQLSWAELRAAVPRQSTSSLASSEQAAEEIIAAVRAEGAAALRRYARRFDGVEQQRLRVDPAEIR
ncbi:histidinol dehydrogenase, partial [Kocuria oceani]